ncbi:ClbS/DfsB family four-helix bundle protein [Campylobacter sp. CCUG 57310]|uniref:ClbS/DfsB family four-helix bundle protein n=1 Tax=Campylobacter sp. CCUG 57310 TaxID=2517362 RepID=UPI0020B14352|nr:ClbS/DfsB family four-helix bundle protein [Campylobacter sp. CCUG 57310]
MLKNSHKEAMKAVDKFSDEELLLKANLPILLALRLEVTVYQPPLHTMIGQ